MKAPLLVCAMGVLIGALSAANDTCEMRHLLGTYQFAIFGSQACQRAIEVYPGDDGYCPKTLKHIWKNSGICEMTNAKGHLMRDVHGRRPPQILYVAQGAKLQGKGHLYIDTIDWPSKTSNASSYLLPEIKRGQLNDAVFNNYATDNVKHSIFDTRNQFLYIITHSHFVASYFVQGSLKKGTLFPHLLSHHAHEALQTRDNYLADPYAHTLYYTERRREGGLDLYVMPMEDFLHSLFNGVAGKYVTSFPENRKLISVSDGVLVSRLKENMTTMFRDLKVNGTDVCACEHNAFSGFEANFLILRDWDYCMARYGMDPEYCEFERKEAIKSLEISNDKTIAKLEIDWQIVLLWILVAALTIVIMLLIFSLTRTLHYRNKYADSQEKCQFLQEQAASANYFPGNVGYASEMDVTVDRYN
ncbi:unnamed protein product, partial [Mesorhabditis belari]|uniref:Uncharacterized protein n=1 Tax=Mesorhabditis belari TaxID=2138241 RepID=A0AAF3EF66_9BILA